MTLFLTPDHLQTIKIQAERSYPNECCGLLLGQRQGDRKTVSHVWATDNAWDANAAAWLAQLDPPLAQDCNSKNNSKDNGKSNSKGDRYWIDPSAMLAAQRYGRHHDCEIIGIYHSHPDHSAIPSECDRRLAWSVYSYLIVSVQQGIVQDLLSWSLDDCSQFQPEPLLIDAATFPETVNPAVNLAVLPSPPSTRLHTSDLGTAAG